MSGYPVWPFRLFLAVFALVGGLEIARHGLTLAGGFYLLGTAGLLLAGGMEGRIVEDPWRRALGLGLVGLGSVLMLIHLLG